MVEEKLAPKAITVEELEKQLEESRTQYSEGQKQLNQLNNQANQLTTNLVRLEGRIQTLNQQIQTLKPAPAQPVKKETPTAEEGKVDGKTDTSKK